MSFLNLQTICKQNMSSVLESVIAKIMREVKDQFVQTKVLNKSKLRRGHNKKSAQKMNRFQSL
jgi:hypothetical protein